MIFTLNALVWLGLVVLFGLLEAATVSLVSIWFAAGAVGALITSAFTPSISLQIIVFLVIGFVSLAITRPLLKKHLPARPSPTNADRNIGRNAIVIVEIQPGFPGRVKLDDVDWSAQADIALHAGTVCVVTAVHGATLTVTPEPTMAAAT